MAIMPDTRQIARVLASEWGVSMAQAVDMALVKAYWQEFGRAPKAKAGDQ
jgi:hypothetical protein